MDRQTFYEVILDIAKEPQSYTLRERFTREPETVKSFISMPHDKLECYIGLKIVDIL